jgi:hypothetical protein
MERDAIEQDEFDADFAEQGEVEFDEVDAEESSMEIEELAERVRAARLCGA